MLIADKDTFRIMPSKEKSSSKKKGLISLKISNKRVFKSQERDKKGKFGKVKAKNPNFLSKDNLRDFSIAKLKLSNLRSISNINILGIFIVCFRAGTWNWQNLRIQDCLPKK